MSQVQTAEHEFTAEHVRLIGFGLSRIFEMAQQAHADHPDQVACATLRVTSLVAKRLNDTLRASGQAAALEGLTWHAAKSGELAGILQVQMGTFGAAILPQVLGAALQALVATKAESIEALARKSLGTWADDYTSTEVKAAGLADERARLAADRHAAIQLLSEVLEYC